MIWHIYTTDIISEHMPMCSFLVWKNACLNYREFDLEDDLVGVPHTLDLSAQSFIRLLKLVWREYDIVAMNEWKKKCVGLQRTWVCKRTVSKLAVIFFQKAFSAKGTGVETVETTVEITQNGCTYHARRTAYDKRFCRNAKGFWWT